MILLALEHELAATTRSVARLAVLALFLGASLYAIVAGLQFHEQWEQALEASDAAQQESLVSARSWLTAGATGPEDRPWVDISAPLWQDWYAGSRAQRAPAPFAGIATGAVDLSPVVMRVHRTADPFGATGIRLENPEFDSTQRIDLVFVFMILIPILISVLGIGVGAFEREHGMERLIAIQAGRSSSWFIARALAVTAIALVAVLAVTIAAAWLFDAGSVETLRLAALASLYTLLWGGIATAVGISASSVRESAFAYGLVWAAVCILIPAFLAERGLATSGSAYELESSLGARAIQSETYERELDEILPELYAAFPNLTELPAADLDELPSTVSRHAYDGLLVLELERRHRNRRQRELDAERALDGAIWISPAIALSAGVERLAGRGASASSDFRDHVVQAVRARVEWVLERAWQMEPLDGAEFEALVAASPSRYEAKAGGVARPSLIIALWAIAAWLFGVVRLRRSSLTGS